MQGLAFAVPDLNCFRCSGDGGGRNGEVFISLGAGQDQAVALEVNPKSGHHRELSVGEKIPLRCNDHKAPVVLEAAGDGAGGGLAQHSQLRSARHACADQLSAASALLSASCALKPRRFTSSSCVLSLGGGEREGSGPGARERRKNKEEARRIGYISRTSLCASIAAASAAGPPALLRCNADAAMRRWQRRAWWAPARCESATRSGHGGLPVDDVEASISHSSAHLETDA